MNQKKLRMSESFVTSKKESEMRTFEKNEFYFLEINRKYQKRGDIIKDRFGVEKGRFDEINDPFYQCSREKN